MVDKDALQSWMLEHDEATKDIESHYNKRIEDMSSKEMLEWISRNDNIYGQYIKDFNIRVESNAHTPIKESKNVRENLKRR